MRYGDPRPTPLGSGRHLGKGHTKYVRPEDVPSLARELENYRKFRELTKRWVQLEIELSALTREEGRREKG